MRNDLKVRAREALSEYLAAYPWSLWFTSTSRDKDSCRYPTVALARASAAVSQFQRAFVAAERHVLGGWHSHGLVFTGADPGLFEYQRVVIQDGLSRHGFCRVEPANSWEAVSRYVAKYILKENDAEWTILGTHGWGARHRLDSGSIIEPK